MPCYVFSDFLVLSKKTVLCRDLSSYDAIAPNPINIPYGWIMLVVSHLSVRRHLSLYDDDTGQNMQTQPGYANMEIIMYLSP